MSKEEQLKELRVKIKSEEFTPRHPVRMDLFLMLLDIVEDLIEESSDDGR